MKTTRSQRALCSAALGILLVASASACNGQGGGPIASALPSQSLVPSRSPRPTLSLSPIRPSDETGGGGSVDDATETPSTPPFSGSPTGGGGGGSVTLPPTTITTIVIQTSESPAATETPAGASASSSAPWGWIALGALLVILLVALIARSSGRRGAERADWRTQALHAYAEGAGLVDAITLETSSPATGDQAEWIRRWSDIDRRADSLTTELHEVETGSPDPETTQIVTDLGSSLTILRTSMRSHAEAGPGTSAGPLSDRVQEFSRALQVFRARLG